jgi:hypothetical protein
MNTKSSNFNGFLYKRGMPTAVVLAILVVVGACSSSDDDITGNTETTVTAFNFDGTNSTLAAEIAAAAMSFFPEYTAISLAVIDILTNPNSDPNDSPFPVPGICVAGTAELSWNDTDNSGDLTAGDTATLTFTGCDFDGGGDIVNGTVEITATSVSTVPPGFGYTAAINLTVSYGADTTTITANFNANTSSPDGTNFTSVYTGTDQPGQTVTVTENGTEYFKMGCFNVTQMYNDTEIFAGNYELSPSGVIVAVNKVMSLAAGANLSFIGDNMEAGTQRVLSIAAPGCASVGVANGVGDSNGSYLEMQGTGGGNIQLLTFDVNDVETSSIATTWDALTN